MTSPPGRDLVALSLSGGGTKASTFAAESMFYLEAIGLLPKVSMISSVSGGSFAAAYYALSCDPWDTACQAGPEGRVVRPLWQYDEAMPVLQSGFRPMLLRAAIAFLVPGVTTPVYSETFAEFIDQRYLRRPGTEGPRARFADLNPRRPLLVLNSTLLSGGRELAEATRGERYLRRRTADEYLHFAFTDYYFARIGSDLPSLPLGYGVASSAAFPAIIGYGALKNYRCTASGAPPSCIDDERFMLTLTDGGANDNQGLVEVFATMAELAAEEARSDLSRQGTVSPFLERMQDGDRALILVINSSLTETTGVDSPRDKDFLLGTISRASAAVDGYSAVAFNLRKQLYTGALERLQAKHDEYKLRAVEIGLTTLNHYQEGGAELALMAAAGLDGSQALVDAKAVKPEQESKQQEAFTHVVARRSRADLKLGAVHPQCLFEVSKLVEKSLSGLAHLTPNSAVCLRHAARWSTALRGEELCRLGNNVLNDRQALRCTTDGHLAPLDKATLGDMEECQFLEYEDEDVAAIIRRLRRNPTFMIGVEDRHKDEKLPFGEDVAALRALCAL